MISDPTLFVECDRCGERVDFTFAFVLARPGCWRDDEIFNGWFIDWRGAQGNALCPGCAEEDGEES